MQLVDDEDALTIPDRIYHKVSIPRPVHPIDEGINQMIHNQSLMRPVNIRLP